jgi:hypothetical protein
MGVFFFGYSDAANEKEVLSQYFYKQPLFSDIKLDKKAEGVSIIVGSKGSGKTALSQAIQNERKDSIIWNLEQVDGFQPNEQMLGNAAISESVLRNILATGVIERIRKAGKQIFSEEALDQLKKLEDGAFQKIAKFISTTGKVSLSPNAPGIEFDFSKLRKNKDLDVFQRIDINEYVNVMRPALSEHRAYILIDDVDTIFPGGEQSDEFLEGIVSACVRLNNAFSSDLHCLVFLNSGMYEKYFKSARTYDKCREFIGKIRWDSEELAEMLAMRIKYRLNISEVEPAWKSWKRAFNATNKQDVAGIQKYMIERCNSGPRDLINFGNLAKERSGNNLISMSNIKNAEGDYSHEKLFLLNRDYGLKYDKLSELLEAVFAGQSISYKAKNLEEHISTKLFGNADIRQAYGSLEYLKYGSPRAFMELLYRTGFIGYKTKKTTEFTFSMAVPDSGDQLHIALEHRIHPAYQKYLGLTN